MKKTPRVEYKGVLQAHNCPSYVHPFELLDYISCYILEPQPLPDCRGRQLLDQCLSRSIAHISMDFAVASGTNHESSVHMTDMLMC